MIKIICLYELAIISSEEKPLKKHIASKMLALKLKGHCIEFKYYADGIHSGLTPPG